MHIETESMNNICHSKLACIFKRDLSALETTKLYLLSL